MSSSTKITTFDFDESVFDELETKASVDEKLASLKKETWTFTMSDGAVITKEVVIGS